MQDPESHLKRLKIQLPGAVDPSALAVLEPSHRLVVNGQFYWASSPHDAEALRAAPYAYTGPVRDPVDARWFTPTESSPRRDVCDQVLYFSNPESTDKFDQDPEVYLK